MPKTYSPPQPFEEGPAPHIAMTPTDSSQLHSRGFDPATNTLAIRFNAPGDRDKPLAERAGADAVYHYPNRSAEEWAAFLVADSAGIFFGQHFKALPFKKYRIATAAA